MPAPQKRRLASWVDAFLDYTEPRRSPKIFRKWAGINAIAAALERKVHLRTGTGPLYPNIYTLLIGPPGTGKTVGLKAGTELIRSIEEIFLAPTHASGPSLMDALSEAKRVIIDLNQPLMEFNSMAIFSNELSSLIPAYDNTMMGTLTDIYDGDPIKEYKRTKTIRIEIKAPSITMIAATTPEYLNNLLPEGAWGEGFMSRVIMVFSDEVLKKPIFEIVENDSELLRDLRADLRSIFNLTGQFRVTAEVAKLLDNFDQTGGQPQPKHYKLVNYVTRRTAHLMKLAMLACASRSNELIINTEDYQTAIGWLFEAEAQLGHIFRAMGSGGTDGQAINDAWEFLFDRFARSGKPVAEYMLVQFLQQRVPPYSVMRIIDLLVTSRMVEASMSDSHQRQFVPKGKQEHDKNAS